MKTINVYDVVGKNAISMQSGEKLYGQIISLMEGGESVELSFKNVTLYASPFFNASIGLLLKDIDVDELMRRLKVVDISDVGRDLLNHVVENAIAYYGDSESVTKGINGINSEGGDHD